MVKRSWCRFLISIIVIQQLLSACSLGQWWGENTKPSVLSQNELSGAACAEPEKILSGTDEESRRTLACWTDKINKIWTQVHGDRPDSLSEAEINTLIKENIIKSSSGLVADSEATKKRLFAAKALLGFSGDITKAKMDEWLAWATKNRVVARRVYRKFKVGGKSIFARDLEDGIRLVSEALRKMSWAMDSDELAHALIEVFDISDRDIREAMIPGAEVAVNLLNMICPTLPKKDLWDSRGMAACLTRMSQQFQVGEPWYEFLLNPISSISRGQILRIKNALKLLDLQVTAWFNDPALSPLIPARWLELSRRMGANPPDNMLDALRIVRRYNRRSNEEAIYPEAIVRIFHIIKDTQENILDGISEYLQATQRRRCENPEASYWTECALKDYENAVERSPSLKIAWKVRNLHHGQAVAALNGREFSKTLLFHRLAGEVIELFHDDCEDDKPSSGNDSGASRLSPFRLFRRENCDPGFITTDLGKENDNLVELITVGVRTSETVVAFLENVRKRLRHISPVDKPVSILDPRWDLRSLARLVASSSDILVKRTPEELNLLTHLISLINLPTPTSLSLDQLAVTAILTTIDLLPTYREPFISFIEDGASKGNFFKDPYSSELRVRRSAALESLPRYLKATFPRTYESCEKFGFRKSCGITFDSILASPPKGSEYIHASDLDILTIVAVAIEGLIDTCDRDANSRLGWSIFKGDAELDCGYAKTQDILMRLMDANILNMSKWDNRKAKTILFFINSTPLTRINGKVAIARGTAEYLAGDIFLAPFYDEASLGSIYGLISDIADPTRARAEPSALSSLRPSTWDHAADSR